ITYANRLPAALSGRQVFLVDPMLATGHTLVASIEYLLERGAKDVVCICLLAAPEGVRTLEETVGDRANVNIVTAAIDERLDQNAYIDRKSTRLNSSHVSNSYADFCLKKKKHRY